MVASSFSFFTFGYCFLLLYELHIHAICQVFYRVASLFSHWFLRAPYVAGMVILCPKHRNCCSVCCWSHCSAVFKVFNQCSSLYSCLSWFHATLRQTMGRHCGLSHEAHIPQVCWLHSVFQTAFGYDAIGHPASLRSLATHPRSWEANGWSCHFSRGFLQGGNFPGVNIQ